MISEKLVLAVADYVIVGSTLTASAIIGIYFQFANKRKSNEEYFLANKDMPILPVSFSLMATFLSAISIMGMPAKIYLYGTSMAFLNVGFILGPIISAYVFLPVFFAVNASTAYEYLEKRFGKAIRRITSGMFALQLIFYTSLVLYAPCLALSAVTSLSMWTSIISVGVACTFYCSIGGMKAVLWADFLQALLMFTGLLAVIVKGCLDLGGIDKVFKIAEDGGRIIVPTFSFDFGVQYTMWNVFLQGLLMTISAYGGSQVQVQRLMTLKSLKRSKIALFFSIPIAVSFHLLCCFSGLIIFAYFESCDPLSGPNKPIHAADQLLPYFIASTMSEFPGLSGLCVSGIFSASLSTISSSINALASLTTEDFIRPFCPNVAQNVSVTKFLSLLFGVVCMFLSFVMASMGNMIRIAVVIISVTAGPNLGIFILAACTKTATEEGTILGAVAGVILAACLSLILQTNIDTPLPLSNECFESQYMTNQSAVTSTTSPTIWNSNTTITVPSTSPMPVVEGKYSLSYMWIATIATITCLIVGFVASIISRWIRGNYDDVPDLYLSPLRKLFERRNLVTEIVDPERETLQHECIPFGEGTVKNPRCEEILLRSISKGEHS